MEEYFEENGKLSRGNLRVSSWTIYNRAFRSILDWVTFITTIAFTIYLALLRCIFDFLLDSRYDGSSETSRIEPPKVTPTVDSADGGSSHGGNKNRPTTAAAELEVQPPSSTLYEDSPCEDVSTYNMDDTEKEILCTTVPVHPPSSFKYESSDEEENLSLNKEEEDQPITAPLLTEVELQFQSQEFSKEKTDTTLDEVDKSENIDLLEESKLPTVKSSEGSPDVAVREVIASFETKTSLPEESKTDTGSLDEVTKKTSDLVVEFETQATLLLETESKDECSLGEEIVNPSNPGVESDIQTAPRRLESSTDECPSEKLSADSSDLVLESESQTETHSTESVSKDKSPPNKALLRSTNLVIASETFKSGAESKQEHTLTSADKKTSDHLDDSAEKATLVGAHETQTAGLPHSHADLKEEECLGNSKKSDIQGASPDTKDLDQTGKKAVAKSEGPVVVSKPDTVSKDELKREIGTAKSPVKATQLKKTSLLKMVDSKISESAREKTEGSPKAVTKTKPTGGKSEESPKVESKIQPFLKSKESPHNVSKTKQASGKAEEPPKVDSKTRRPSVKAEESSKIPSKTKQASGKSEESVKTASQTTKHAEEKSRESTKTGNKSKRRTPQRRKT